MKKKNLTVVCICIATLLCMTIGVSAKDNRTNKNEYGIDIVRAVADTQTGNVSVRILSNSQDIQSVEVIGLFFDADGSLTECVTVPATEFNSDITLCPKKEYETGKVTVWEKLTSLKPVAKAVNVGFEAKANYTVEYYRQNVERNGYNLYETSDSVEMPVGQMLSVDVTTLPTYDGFTFDSENSSNILWGIIQYDGLTLKVYYNYIYDDLEMQQVTYRLNKVLTTFTRLQGNFTDDEKVIVKTVKTTIEAVLTDKDAGALIYVEGYVAYKYPDAVDDARKNLDILRDKGGYNDFESKLTRYLSMADVEYLAKVMFGIDDIYQYK